MQPLRTGDRGIQFGSRSFESSRNHPLATPPDYTPPVTQELSDRRPEFDMAAPLIGSTGAMRRLRATIERVACTDFTILLEGPRRAS
jgi:transcriptional regulator with AAA-type ATPase domain